MAVVGAGVKQLPLPEVPSQPEGESVCFNWGKVGARVVGASVGSGEGESVGVGAIGAGSGGSLFDNNKDAAITPATKTMTSTRT